MGAVGVGGDRGRKGVDIYSLLYARELYLLVSIVVM